MTAIPKLDHQSAQSRWWHDQDSIGWPIAALALLLIAQFSLVFTRAINWDEFYFFHEVARFADGQLDRPLQTFHTRLFFWLPGLFETSVDHIVAARTAMYLAELVTLLSIFALAQHFTDRTTAIFAAVLYLSSGYVLQHGMSFRVDPMVTAALISALAILGTSRLDLRGIAAFSVCVALAGMISIKCALYLPAFAGIAFMRLSQADWSRTMAIRLAAASIAALMIFAIMFWLHSRGVTSDRTVTNSSAGLLKSSSKWMFFVGVPPYWLMGIKGAMIAPVMAAIVLITPFAIWRSSRDLAEKVALTGLWAPILSVMFYMNTAAYFYAFILAPVSVAGLAAIHFAVKRFAPMLVAVTMTAVAAGVFLMEDRSTINRQRQLERNVHEIFGQPVTYFDHNYMLGNWDKANGFMTPWGMANYRAAGIPKYRHAMEDRVVPLLLANWWTLRAMIEGSDDTLLLPQDNAALRNNYIEFSPFIYIAGKEFPAGSKDLDTEFLVPGSYTLRGGGIVLDGTRYENGEVLNLARGFHTVSVPGQRTVRIVWGDNLPKPNDPLEPGPLYVGF